MTDESQSIFESMSVCAWKVDGGASLKIAVTNISERGGNRLVRRQRPYRDGAKLDDTGRNEVVWTITALFINSINEPGLDQSIALYPDVLDAVIASFDVHKTGTLTLPTRGDVRARASTYSRSEVETLRDAATLTLEFVEDNEDNVDAQKFTARTANASMGYTTAKVAEDAQRAGTWSTSFGELREFGSELEGIANFPGETISDVDAQASIVVSTANGVLRAFAKADRENQEFLSDPKAECTQRRLEETQDIAAQTRKDARNGRAGLTTYVVAGACTLFDVAIATGTAVEDLIDVNPGVNPFAIKQGTTIRKPG